MEFHRERSAGSVQARLDRLGTYPKRRSRLGLAHSFHDAQQQRLLKRLRQRGYKLPQNSRGLTLLGGHIWAGPRIGDDFGVFQWQSPGEKAAHCAPSGPIA